MPRTGYTTVNLSSDLAFRLRSRVLSVSHLAGRRVTLSDYLAAALDVAEARPDALAYALDLDPSALGPQGGQAPPHTLPDPPAASRLGTPEGPEGSR